MRQPRRPGRPLLLLLGLIVGPLLSCPELRDDFALLRDDFALDDAPPPPNVMLILVDTLRQDHLSLYGYARNTSPRIDALGASGVVFENHLSHASQTVPSIVSIMLSQLPAEHG
ncbi:MAG: sulfatase-like hydrolase/transferase, partial [Myxococcales bacterium]|nr:sulfatase-like hydrolase/transferase [Myxococcales bacterium]